ncbi:hypothetical protein BKA67DRAFT_665350 [Truncatella angustata]|uniref:Rhodopsin domain-containing protein n=1 Tax=Truncatella angustata TaxID=152316 RepID=A0A9P8REG5_9PEZI|nr:uncharacterized protein BKA67DRAFT_665350 [Truncatella angustata]KAH6639968.1 hypothetical protein BKA67DRAFT_665350 [Truncatella angustata]KAH8200646.1 hypothetical protein TruAng_005183 [Truncatella angustata]
MAPSVLVRSASASISPEVAAALPPELQAQIPLYDENLQPNLYAADVICLVAAYLAVGLRIFARRLKAQPFGWDDYLIFMALFFTTIFVSLCIFVAVYGLGRHTIVTAVEHPERIVPFAKATLAAGVIYNPALVCSKVSILTLYYRLFPSKRFKWVCIGVGAFVIAYSVTAVMTNIFQCTPVESNWDKSIKAHCVNLGSELVAVSSLNVLTDATILCLPMPFIWRLKTDFRRKLQLTCIFLLGSFVVIVSIIRVTYVSGVSFSDGFWVNSFPSMWSVVESCVAIVAACLPVLRPVFNKILYGDPERTDRSGSGKNVPSGQPSFERHIVTIGGSEIPLGNYSNGSGPKRPSRGINVTNSTTVSRDQRFPKGSFERLTDTSSIGH